MFHLSAFYQSVDPGGVLTLINAVREEQLFTNGIDLRVPAGLNRLVGTAAVINDAANTTQVRLEAPSLRNFVNINVEPIAVGTTFGSTPEYNYLGGTPIPLMADEALNAAVQSDPAAAAAHYVFVMLGDGPLTPVDGEIFSVRATSAIAQTAGTWVNGNITLSQVLPAGKYQVVGFRARSADLVAARLVFSAQVGRPGVPAVNAVSDQDVWEFRLGRSGVWGEFPNTIPPTVDVLGGAAATQHYILDLLRVG